MRERRRDEKRSGDPFLRLTGVQLLCCAVLAALLLAAFRFGGGLYQRLREEFLVLQARHYHAYLQSGISWGFSP